MKLVILVLGLLLAMPFAMALSQNHAISDPDLTRDRSGKFAPFIKGEVSKKSSGSTFVTRYVWNGKTCMKQDVYSQPALYNVGSVLHEGYKEIEGKYPAPQGKRWVVKVMEGEFGVVLNSNGLPSPYGCQVFDEAISVNLNPLPYDWYKK